MTVKSFGNSYNIHNLASVQIFPTVYSLSFSPLDLKLLQILTVFFCSVLTSRFYSFTVIGDLQIFPDNVIDEPHSSQTWFSSTSSDNIREIAAADSVERGQLHLIRSPLGKSGQLIRDDILVTNHHRPIGVSDIALPITQYVTSLVSVPTVRHQWLTTQTTEMVEHWASVWGGQASNHPHPSK